MTAWNRDDDHTAVERNLDAAPFGFKVTGDAAMFPDSTDFAMFSDEANVMVRDMVNDIIARMPSFATIEVAHDAIAEGRKRIAKAGHGEVYDTMVRETIAYALDAAMTARFGERVDQWAI